jgi:DNA-binding HxlR family transcriptional regulator
MSKKKLNFKCPIEATVKVLSGKRKMWILFLLMNGTKRFSELKREIPEITQRMLTAHLRELEADKIIIRKVYPVVPPKVEYSLSEIGESLKSVLSSLQSWGVSYIKKVSNPDL